MKKLNVYSVTLQFHTFVEKNIKGEEQLFIALRTFYNIREKSIGKPFKSCQYRPDMCKEKIIIALYRSHSSVLHEFFVHLIDIREQIVKDCYITLVGDLNINIQVDGCGHKQLLHVANIL
jgi:hypothetical protein